MERPGSATREMPALTRREQDVLTALCAPLAAERPVAMPASIREIAAELVVTEAAVKQHLLNLYDKFEIAEGTESRRIALAREAVLRGFLPGVGATPAGRTSRLDAGRAAASDRAWEDAYAALSEAAGSTPLDVADLELLGDAATWTGRFDASTAARERAYAVYLARGDPTVGGPRRPRAWVERRGHAAVLPWSRAGWRRRGDCWRPRHTATPAKRPSGRSTD